MRVKLKEVIITWTNADPVYWRIYAELWGDELNKDINLMTVVYLVDRYI